MDFEKKLKELNEEEAKRDYTLWIILLSGLVVAALMAFIAINMDWQNLSNYNVLFFTVPLVFLVGMAFYRPFDKVIAGIKASHSTEGEVTKSFFSERTKRNRGDNTADIRTYYNVYLTISYNTDDGLKTATILAGNNWHRDKSHHNATLERYSEGTKVKLYYSPDSYSKPMLKRFSFIYLVAVVLFGVLFYGFCGVTGAVIGTLL
jgi:flagellar basal body-associated protein FliL